MATELDMIAGSQLRDTQGETLDIKGCDISELERGAGYINDGHSNKLPDVLGRVTYAKKILKIEDCEDDRQRYYWEKVKAPYVYVRAKLFDDEGDHRSAKAAAAILRHQHREDSPLKLKCSVEGGIIERGAKDETLLKRTKLKGVALTFAPANNATLVEGLNLKKSNTWEADEPLIKSLIPLMRTDVPSFIEVAGVLSESKIRTNVERIKQLTKALKEESLEKSVGRISFPKMLGNTRPDQDVAIVDKPEYAVRRGIQADYSSGSKDDQTKSSWESFMHDAGRGTPPPAGFTQESTAVVTPEGAKGPNPSRTQEHEAFHLVFNKLADKHGKDLANGIVNHMLSYLHPDDRKMLNDYTEAAFNKTYTPDEFITGIRDFLTSKEHRDNMVTWHGDHDASAELKQKEEVKNKVSSRIKKAWHAMRNFSNDITLPISNMSELADKHRPDYGLNKALTAGFGGGSPTDATGGQVLQTESIDSGNKVREIECPHCGKGNVYMKYQIRCRGCGKAYPFDTLSKFFTKE